MSRPSKLSESQWQEIGRRLVLGESARSLAREYGVSETAIRKRFGSHAKEILTTAKELSSVEQKVKKMEVGSQALVRTVTDYLNSIGTNLALAADRNTRTSARLAALAETQMTKVEEGDMGALPGVSILTKCSNEAASIGVAFLGTNKPKGESNGPTLEQLLMGTDQ